VGSNADRTVSLIDTRTGSTLTQGGLSLPYRIAISSTGRTAIVTDPEADRLYVADAAERRLLWMLDGIGAPRGVTIAPDGGSAFVTLAGDEAVGVVDLNARRITRKIRVQRSPDGVAYGPAPR
jgi:YVTN family beta-propeller protein